MSKQPRKQRNRQERAQLHERHKQLRAPLSATLRDEYDRRTVRVCTGDTAEVLRGDHAGHEDDVAAVDLKSTAVMIEGVTVEKADGEEVLRPLDASNIRVTALNLDDPRRAARLRREEA